MTLAVGTRLGPYEVVAQLGAGGMGEVYRARDTRLDRDVAIKVLPERVALDPEALSRFEREAKALAALSHPNLLAIHDFGRQGDILFAVTELLDGETLRNRLSTVEMPWRESVSIALSIAEGLAAAHSRGIVHRDLKPENVFLTSDARVKILDFGLARREAPLASGDQSVTPTLTQHTQPGTVLGTIGYISPEQVSGEPGDSRSDIFSFGCVLYEMVTGRRAFHGRNNAETMAAILRDDPVDPMTSGKSLPPDLARVITHCLAREPEQRLQSAQDLAFDLKAVFAGATVSVPPAPLRARRPRGLWMGLAALVMLAAVAGVFLATRHGAPPTPTGAAGALVRSLAVLPLENLSRDSEQEYFADGMTEELNTQLAQIRALKVISRTSATKYKKTTRTIPEIGRELNVDAVVTGSVLRSGEKIRITAHLIRAATDEQLWAESFERNVQDALVLQNEVARAIVEKIRIQTTAIEKARLSGGRPIDPAAYEAYLKGRFYWHKGRTPEYVSKAVEYMNEAIEKDPSYAAPYAGLCETYTALSNFGMLLSQDAIGNARPAVMKAIELDPQSGDAHACLARILASYDWDSARAEREYRLALELNPNFGTAHQWYGLFLIGLGRTEEGLAQVSQAIKLDPFSVVIQNSVATGNYLARRYDEAIEQGKKTIEIDPAYSPVYEVVAEAYEAKGSIEAAFAAYQKYAEVAGYSLETIAGLKRAFESGGMKGYWRRRLEMEKEESAQTGNVWTLTMAHLYARLGDREQALEWLEKMYAERNERIRQLKADPVFDGFRLDPRFQDLLRRVGLPP